MSYFELPTMQYKTYQAQIMEAVLLNPVDMMVCNFVSMGDLSFSDVWSQITLPYDDEVWNLAPHAPQESADVDFKETTDVTYRTGKVVRINKARFEASLNKGTPIDLATVLQVIRRLNKYREAFTFQGPKDWDGNRYGSLGLFNKAGLTSTYTTVKFASASGPYNTVLDMIATMQAQGFGFGRVDIVSDTTLMKYFKYLPATDAKFSEGARIKSELLNGGDIFFSNQLPAATSNDGVLLAVENLPSNYKIEYFGPSPINFDNQWVPDKETDEFVSRLDMFLRMKVFQTYSICKHMTVDLAA